MTSSFDEIRQQLSKPQVSRHRAAALAHRILAVVREGRVSEDEAALLRYAFSLSIAKFGDLVREHVGYAITLATTDRALLYEEMHKLLSLRDEIEALVWNGAEFPEADQRKLELALRERFRREPRNARLAAEDRFKLWKKEWWWYSENLS